MATLQTLPEDVRAQAKKIRKLLNIIQKVPVMEVHPAVVQMNAEIDTLVALANEANERRA